MSIRVQNFNQIQVLTEKCNNSKKEQILSKKEESRDLQKQIISFQGAQALKNRVLCPAFGNSQQLKVIEGKYVIDNIMDADGTKINVGKGSKTVEYTISKDGNTATIKKNWTEKGLITDKETGDEVEKDIPKELPVGSIVADDNFGKINEVRIGLEIQQGGSLSPVIVISQTKDNKKLSIKMERPNKMQLKEKATNKTAFIKIADSSDEKPTKTPAFSGRNNSIGFAGTPSLVTVQCKHPKATDDGVENFINNTSKDLVSDELKGQYAGDENVQELCKNLTSVFFAGGVGSRFIYANPNPERINKPVTPVASQYTFIDLALASIANGGLIKVDELKENKANVNIESGQGAYQTGNNDSKLLMLKGSIDQNTAGATSAAIKDNKIPKDNHLFISMADHVHNIDFSRLAKSFSEDNNAGLVIIAKPMPPHATVNKFGLIAVDNDSFENNDLDYMPNITKFIEKPESENLAAESAVKTPISTDPMALASTGIYLIHKDVANILGKIIPSGQGMDFGGEFFPVMQKVLNPDSDSIFTSRCKDKFEQLLNKEGNEHTTELKQAFVSLEIENKAKANKIDNADANIRVLDELENPESPLSNKLKYIDENITKDDMDKIKTLKMKTWIAQDRDGKDAYWRDLGNLSDYADSAIEIKKDNISNLPTKFGEQLEQNVDPNTRMVCQSPEAKNMLVDFMKNYDIETTGNGNILVMHEEK